MSESVPGIWKAATKGGRASTHVVRQARKGFYASRRGSECAIGKGPRREAVGRESIGIQYSSGRRKVVTLPSASVMIQNFTPVLSV